MIGYIDDDLDSVGCALPDLGVIIRVTALGAAAVVVVLALGLGVLRRWRRRA